MGLTELLIANGYDPAAKAPQEAPAYTVVRLLPSDPTHRKLFPKVVMRAIEFIDALESDTDPIWLMNLMTSHFFQGNNTVHIVAGQDAAGKLIGHSVSFVEHRHMLGNVIVLLQLQKDEGSSDLLAAGMRLIREWATTINVKTIFNQSKDRARSRLWSRYGFYEYRIESRKDL